MKTPKNVTVGTLGMFVMLGLFFLALSFSSFLSKGFWSVVYPTIIFLMFFFMGYSHDPSKWKRGLLFVLGGILVCLFIEYVY